MPKFKEYYFNPGNKYPIPCRWGTTGLMYNRSKVTGAAAQSWSIVFDPNKAALQFINKDDLNNSGIYPSKGVMENLFWIKDPGANMKLLDQAWTRI
jgi:spermidine/putrescine-binding protein